MTYLRRAFKYLLQICIIFVVIITALMLTGFVSGDVSVAFRHGWKSIAYIGAMFAVVSLAYPYFGYAKRNIHAQGDPAEHWALIHAAMASRGYVKAGETENGGYRYHLTGFMRVMRLWEDYITIEPMLNMKKSGVRVSALDGWTAYTKDGLPSAQWEYTIAVFEDHNEILSK